MMAGAEAIATFLAFGCIDARFSVYPRNGVVVAGRRAFFHAPMATAGVYAIICNNVGYRLALAVTFRHAIAASHTITFVYGIGVRCSIGSSRNGDGLFCTYLLAFFAGGTTFGFDGIIDTG